MYKPPHCVDHIDVTKYVLNRQEHYRRDAVLVRRHATAEHLRRGNLYNRKVHGSFYKEVDHVFSITPSSPQARIQSCLGRGVDLMYLQVSH